MWKRKTRKKMLKALDDMIQASSYNPIRLFKIEFFNGYGSISHDEPERFFDVGDIVARLMDLSLTHRIVKVSSEGFVFTKGMCVTFGVMPDKDHMTNIDEEFMDRIMRLNFDGFER